MDEWCPTSSVGVCLDPFVFRENIEGAYDIHVSIDSDTSSGFIRNPSVSVFISKMGSQWASIDTTVVKDPVKMRIIVSLFKINI